MHNPEQEMQQAFERTALHLPSDQDMGKMSFAGLASLLSSCKDGTAEYIMVERKIKMHLAKDQSRINLPNMLYAAGIGGIFALVGVILGWHLTTTPPSEQVTPTSSVQQAKNSNLSHQYAIERVPHPKLEPIPPPVIPRAENSPVVDASNTAKHPAPVQNNESPSN